MNQSIGKAVLQGLIGIGINFFKLVGNEQKAFVLIFLLNQLNNLRQTYLSGMKSVS